MWVIHLYLPSKFTIFSLLYMIILQMGLWINHIWPFDRQLLLLICLPHGSWADYYPQTASAESGQGQILIAPLWMAWKKTTVLPLEPISVNGEGYCSNPFQCQCGRPWCQFSSDIFSLKVWNWSGSFTAAQFKDSTGAVLLWWNEFVEDLMVWTKWFRDYSEMKS